MKRNKITMTKANEVLPKPKTKEERLEAKATRDKAKATKAKEVLEKESKIKATGVQQGAAIQRLISKKKAGKKTEPLNEVEKNRCIKAINNARSVIRLYEKNGGKIKGSDFSNKKEFMETIKDLNELKEAIKRCPKKEQDIFFKALSLHKNKKNSEEKSALKKTTVKTIFDELVDNSSEDILPYTSLPDSSLIMYAEILRRNKNDCSLPLELIRENMKKTEPKEFLKDNAEVIAKEIIRCFKDSQGKKVVVVPLSFKNAGKQVGTHANALLFNTNLMTAEHFEPHGRKDYLPAREGWLKLKGVNLSSSINEINKQLKKLKSDFKFKYEAPLDVCPSESMFKDFKGVQGFDNIPRKPGSPDPIYKGLTIREAGGYCQLWTYFLLELRLKTLSQPASKVYAEYARYRDIYKSNLQDPNKSMKRLIRGYSTIYMDMINRLINEGKFSLEDFLKYRNINKNKDFVNYKKVGADISIEAQRIFLSVFNK